MASELDRQRRTEFRPEIQMSNVKFTIKQTENKFNKIQMKQPATKRIERK